MTAAGKIHVYTGNGKGKTTAALGLTLRAAGAGFRIYFAQFVKAQECGEHLVLRTRFADLVTYRRHGRGMFLRRPPDAADRQAAHDGLAEARAVLAAGQHPLVVLDEVGIALKYGLLEPAELLAALAARAPGVEVVLTGRHMPEPVLAAADLVTEMREIRHYHATGLPARPGIEF